MEKDRAVPGDEEIDKRLEKLELNKQGLIEVAYEVALARKSCTAYDAKNAPGSLAYFSGTKTLREIFCPKGWEVDRKDSVESIINSTGTVKVIFQNVDYASKKSREPKSISKKGPGSRRTVAENQMGFFSNEEIRLTSPDSKCAAWYFCVSVNAIGISAELSLPISVVDGQFSGFYDRIFVLEDGEFIDFPLSNLDVDDYPEIEVKIAKK